MTTRHDSAAAEQHPARLGDMPPTTVLEARLSIATGSRRVTVLDRVPNEFTSTYPTETVTCRLDGSAAIKLFCKHFHPLLRHPFGSGEAPFYEIDVYRRILARIPVSLPRFHGAWTGPDTGEWLLAIEYVGERSQIDYAEDGQRAAESAAAWLGEFHALAAPLVDRPEAAFLQHRNEKFYREMCDRVLLLFSHQESSSWLGRLRDNLPGIFRTTHEPGATVIHGEFYVSNVLARGDRILPVDWEAASIGPGELDLAALVDNWPKVFERCANAYARARNLDASDDPLRRLAGGQVLLYLQKLSYLSDPADWYAGGYLSRLRDSAEVAGLLPQADSLNASA